MLVEWKQEAFWRTHVDACQQQAGLQREYCREHGLSPRDLRKWRTRFHGPMRQRTSEGAGGAHAEAGLEECSYARTEGSPPEAVAGMPVIRRCWTLDQKRQLVWEGLNSGIPLSRFAQEQGITPSAAYRWLREFANPVLASTPEASEPAFASVHVAERVSRRTSGCESVENIACPWSRWCRLGWTCSCRACRVEAGWPRRSAMRWGGGRRSLGFSTTAASTWTPTPSSGRSGRSRSAARTACSPAAMGEQNDGQSSRR